MDACKNTGVPLEYVKWGAIFCIATALGRHAWSVNMKGTTYANLFVLFVGPPGTGKSDLEKLINPLLHDIAVPMAPQHISKASLIDSLNESEVSILSSRKQMMHYNHLCLVSSEFIQTFPGYDIHFLGTLASLWDCPDNFKESKRHMKQSIEIDKTCFNMLTGVQPGILAQAFPAEAWSGGFLARTIFVYSPKKVEIDLRGSGRRYVNRIPESKFRQLKEQLQAIHKTTGVFKEADDVTDAYLSWKNEDQMQPRPRHPKLQYYNDRREHQLEKLAMISAASRGSMEIIGDDYNRGRSWLEMTEINLDDIFLDMAQADDAEIVNDLYAFVIRQGKGCRNPVPYSLAVRFLTGRINSYRIDSFIDLCVESGRFQTGRGKRGEKAIMALPETEMY